MIKMKGSRKEINDNYIIIHTTPELFDSLSCWHRLEEN